MTITKHHIGTTLGIIVVVLLTILLVSMFRRGPATAPEYKQRLADKDSLIVSIGRERDGERAAKDDALQQLRSADSMLQVRYSNTKIIYEKIPVYIRSLNKDSLRAAGERAAN